MTTLSMVESMLDDLNVWDIGSCVEKPVTILVGEMQLTKTFGDCQVIGRLFEPEGLKNDEWRRKPHHMPRDRLHDDWIWLSMPCDMVDRLLEADKQWLVAAKVCRSWRCATVKWETCLDEHVILVPVRSGNAFPPRVLELFAGGYGGWKRALNVIHDAAGIKASCIGVEREWNAVKMYASSLEVETWDALHQHLEYGALDQTEEAILQADVCDWSWLTAIGKWSPTVATLSAPCTSWSKAGHRSGLMSEPGQAMVKALLKIRLLRPTFICFENVPGILSHEDFPMIENLVTWAGYQFIRSSVIDGAKCTAASRPRWIAVAARIATAPHIEVWQSLPENRLTPRSADAIMTMSESMKQDLRITQDVLIMHDRPDMLPHGKKGLDPIKSRITDADCQVPTFMAAYRRQHLLPIGMLKSKGLHTHWVKDGQGEIRWWHGLEMAFLHITNGPIYLAHDPAESWTNLGNLITECHALEPLVNVLNAGKDSENLIDLAEVYHHAHATRLCASNVGWYEDATGIAAGDGTLPNAKEVLVKIHSHASEMCKYQSHGLPPFHKLTKDGKLERIETGTDKDQIQSKEEESRRRRDPELDTDETQVEIDACYLLHMETVLDSPDDLRIEMNRQRCTRDCERRPIELTHSPERERSRTPFKELNTREPREQWPCSLTDQASAHLRHRDCPQDAPAQVSTPAGAGEGNPELKQTVDETHEKVTNHNTVDIAELSQESLEPTQRIIYLTEIGLLCSERAHLIKYDNRLCKDDLKQLWDDEMTEGYRLCMTDTQHMRWIETLECPSIAHPKIYYDPPHGNIACLCTPINMTVIGYDTSTQLLAQARDIHDGMWYDVHGKHIANQVGEGPILLFDRTLQTSGCPQNWNLSSKEWKMLRSAQTLFLCVPSDQTFLISIKGSPDARSAAKSFWGNLLSPAFLARLDRSLQTSQNEDEILLRLESSDSSILHPPGAK